MSDTIIEIKPKQTQNNDRRLLLQLLASLTLCDDMGDVCEDMICVLKEIDEYNFDFAHIDDDEDWNVQLRKHLHAKGITTLYGTELVDEDE